MKRNWIRAGILVGAAILARQLLPWRPAAMGFVALSPILSLLGALAARTATGWMFLGIPVLVLGFFRSRWFCRYMCPVGFATEQVGRLNRNARRRFVRIPNIGRALFLLLLGGAAAGYPLFIWLDPLSLFNGFFSAGLGPAPRAAIALAAGFPVVLLVSLVFPQAWCHRLCPLGALQDVLSRFRRLLRRSQPVESSPPAMQLAVSRRDFLGVAVGGAAALVLRRSASGKALPIRPPGARPETEFTGLCARCGACIRACPYGILRPDVGQTGLTGLWTPIVDYSRAHCFEFCNECARICPTGAIARLALEAKRNRAMGLAKVDRDKCIAWRDGQYCMVCHEFCPYLAVDATEHHGVNCPVVNPDMCRGCGACQVACPALPDKAIVVHGIPQHPARPLEEGY